MANFTRKIDGPVAVIGDIHGQVDKLETLLTTIEALPDYSKRWLVFVGDYVDRGPDPRGAIDAILDVMDAHRRTTAIAGNHDLAMAAALGWVPTPEYSNWGQRWLDHYDAETTFASYGAEFEDFDDLADKVPDDHREFLAGLPWCVEHSQYLFVHAGLDTETPFEVQMQILRQRDFTLNRPSWLCSKSLVDSEVPADCPYTVVSGHVRVPEVQFGRKRVLVDTTGGEDGDLSCVLLPEKKVITSVGEEVTSGGKGWWKLW